MPSNKYAEVAVLIIKLYLKLLFSAVTDECLSLCEN